MQRKDLKGKIRGRKTSVIQVRGEGNLEQGRKKWTDSSDVSGELTGLKF